MRALAVFSCVIMSSVISTGCYKKATLATNNANASGQLSQAIPSSVEALTPKERLANSYLNPQGKRLDATGRYYLDEQGNIIGMVEVQTTADTPLTTLSAQQQLAKHSTVYFDYDSSQLSSDNQSTLNLHAGYLTSKPTVAVSIEGHTDQRGTREYNLALGDRRAKQVQDYLQFTGVKPSQISTISYGKEKLVDNGTSEESYQKNRRAQLVYP